MPTIRDLVRPGMDWPPAGHADRIEAQEIHALIARNRRHELVQTFSLDLLRGVLEQEEVIPFPAAKIAARTLAAFLFGEDPTFTHDDDTVAAAVSTLVSATNLPATLLEAAYTQAAEGEIYLRPTWDLEVDPDHAMITAIAGHRVLPRFRYGRLLDGAVVTTWISGRGTRGAAVEYRRLIEFYVPGGIERRAYVGNAGRLGSEVALDRLEETDGLEDKVDTGIDDRPTLVHVPLGRWDADSPHGVSLFDGLESLILGMHRLYSQEQHDAEIVRKRVAVSEEFLKRDAAGNPVFDRRTDLLVLAEEAAGSVGAERKPIEPIEFSDDLVQRERIAGRFREFLIACGIAPDTLDANESGGAISGTSRRLAQALTLQTVASIGRYWQQAVPEALEIALHLERIHLGADLPTDGLRPTMTLADGLVTDEAELATILATLDTAEAISAEQKIRRLHPEWDNDQVLAEVAAVRGNTPPDPIPSFR